MIDPVFPFLVSVSFALLFGLAGAHKARDLAQTARTIEDYGLVSRKRAILLAPLIASLEIVTAAGLLYSGTRPLAAFAAAGLLLIYGAAMALALTRGAGDADCGCSFGGNSQPLSSSLVVRNVALAGLVLIAALPPLPRTFGFLDFFTVLFALMAATLVYAAVNTLIKNKTALVQL